MFYCKTCKRLTFAWKPLHREHKVMQFTLKKLTGFIEANLSALDATEVNTLEEN